MELEKIKSGPYKGSHRGRYLWLNGRRVRIDVNIADLVDGLNRLGIVTRPSCGGSCYGACRRKHRLLEVRDTYCLVNGKRKRTKLYRSHKPKLCQQSASIAFLTTRHAMQFMNIVFRGSDSEKLREHMQGHGTTRSHAWTWKCYVEDINDHTYCDSRGYTAGEHVGSPKFDFYSVVVIPHAHLDLVTERVLERCRKRGV